IMAALSNNSLEVYNLPPAGSSKAAPIEPIKLYSLDIPGHRSDVRTLCVSSDDTLLASAANGSLKLWNLKTTQCVRTMDCGYALCSTFLPGDKHIVVGTKTGELLLFDLSSSSLLETIPAHTGAVWGIHVRPDGRGLVSGSADKDIKFWDFEVREVAGEGLNEGGVTGRVLTMAHTKTLKMTDDVLAIKYSPDGKLLAVSLLDSTVKVFFADTLKFFLSLYGHKLPVLSLDISSDSKLIITCSADKNIKIWGLDFGDCHRSLFAHEESIMQVAFERGTHYFWSVGKDKMVKYWDGDKFECIQKLDGHHGEVWALAVSNRGNFVATGSHDKSIRIWEKTDEPLFLEEERERELEELYDSNVNARDRDELRVLPNGEEAPGPESTEVTKSTTETLMAGERIMEALEISEADQALTKAHQEELAPLSAEQRAKIAAPPRNPIFGMYNGIGPQEYVLKVVRQIPAASLHDALLVLPFGRVTQLIEHLDYWAHKEWQITLTSRVLFFLLRTHHSQIVATRALRNTMISLRTHLREALRRQKDSVGYNLAALKFIQRQNDANKSAEFYEQGGGMVEEEKVREIIEKGVKKHAPTLVACPAGSLITRTGSPIDNTQALDTDEAAYISRRRAALPSLWTSYAGNASTGTTGYNYTQLFLNNNYPRLGTAVSGGGFRASLYGAGTLSALDSRNATNVGGLLQLSDYLSGLSGGSWIVTSLMMSDLSDLYSLVVGLNGESGWELDLDLLAPDGLLGVGDNIDYYNDLLDDVRAKADAGFPISLVDIWGRALSYHFFNQTDAANFYEDTGHDAGLLFSSIALTLNFQNAASPFPIVVTTSRINASQQLANTSDTTVIPLSNTQFEITPYHFGSYDPTLQAHIPVQYAGTYLNNGTALNSSACVNGFENAGFVIGSSAALFNAAEDVIGDSTFLQLIDTLGDDITSIQSPNYSIPLVANWPNSFYNFAPADGQAFESAGENILQITDGGENGENVPIAPLLVKARNLDIILAIDASADTNQYWPNGTSLIATADRVAGYFQGNYTSFPPVPETPDIFVQQGLNIRPTFFGCNTTGTGNSSNPGEYPIVVYLPNAPSPDGTGFLTNTSTFKLDYSADEYLPFLDSAHSNALKGFQTNGSLTDPDYALCLKCAIVDRARHRAMVDRSPACSTCMNKYCWSETSQPDDFPSTSGNLGSTSGTGTGGSSGGGGTSAAATLVHNKRGIVGALMLAVATLL
ncbi:hypothetical protein MNV49_003208, partial [Pseudohyphozyma bogoriensis]